MIEQPSIKLYTVYYKHFPLVPKASYLVPIQAGAAIHPRLPMLGDDTGENISYLNNYYSELTAAYWILKNAERNTDAWGLCHYRRYLIPLVTKYFFKQKSRYYFKTSQPVLDQLLTDKLYTHLSELLTTAEVIVQKPAAAKREGRKVYTIKEGYFVDHRRMDWEMTMQVVIEKYPGYAKSIQEFGEEKYMCFNNVMITTWPIWEEYLNWLFSIFFEVQQRIILPGKGYNERVFGFLGERLHNLFIFHNGLKPAYLTLGLFEN